jgi:hypothetical protein
MMRGEVASSLSTELEADVVSLSLSWILSLSPSAAGDAKAALRASSAASDGDPLPTGSEKSTSA